MSQILLKRAYEAAAPSDGYRIYVDRLWPQGLSHATFPYDMWDKAVAPSSELRTWYHHAGYDYWPVFRQKYIAELKDNPAYDELRTIVAEHPVVTLIYSSHNTTQNNAVVLQQLLEKDQKQ